ncbi:MAG: hypothetical protein JSW03_01920, partial [Candidatus Eiseniibacteriota bacterium]
AVLAYLWGESTHSFATVPAKAGESVRIVGTDDFIVGAQGRKVNRFHEMIMGLVERHPGKVRFFQYNTGGIGEVIETFTEGGQTKKRLVRKVTRIPIPFMAAIQRGDLRGTNRYEPGRFGTKEIVSCEAGDLRAYDPAGFYSEEEIDRYLTDLLEGRKAFTQEIANQGLKPEIVKLAEESFAAMGRELRPAARAADKAPAEPVAPAEAPGPQASVSRWISPWIPRSRPPRQGGPRGS